MVSVKVVPEGMDEKRVVFERDTDPPNLTIIGDMVRRLLLPTIRPSTDATQAEARIHFLVIVDVSEDFVEPVERFG